ncbi:hypothetical protein GMRT_13315 [Giardia muris]|uniref:Uncharacterized protein n=1 Tax=Giardia muris TaxID=5742 RepID=A0A4Z1SRL4_GIAMU|nr:hypothetical protein GMRT_13315 [Giardia muris]|eukprot:TNJ26278.1 hypothetical protein GMRT_13315 [Giardia muris]
MSVAMTDMAAELARLEAEVAEDLAEIQALRTQYHQAEHCLQNWAGKFHAFPRQSTAVVAVEDSHVLVAPIGTLEYIDDGRSLVLTISPHLIGACRDMKDWERVWLLGLTSAPEANEIIISRNASVLPLTQIPLAQQSPFNYSVRIAKHVLEHAPNVPKPMDPFTFQLSPACQRALEATGLKQSDLFLANFLCELQTVAGNVLTLRPDSLVPRDFIVLDMKVYHPCESVTKAQLAMSEKTEGIV